MAVDMRNVSLIIKIFCVIFDKMKKYLFFFIDNQITFVILVNITSVICQKESA